MEEKKDTLFVNLFGGPGISKSTTAAGIFALLKLHDIDCELIPEYAKELCWEERNKTIQDQTYVFGKQYHANWVVGGKIDVAITDAPFLLSIYYDQTCDTNMHKFILSKFMRRNNMNILLERHKKYNPNGRWQTEEEAIAMDAEIAENLLNFHNIPFKRVKGDFTAVNKISHEILAKKGRTGTLCDHRPRYQITKFI